MHDWIAIDRRRLPGRAAALDAGRRRRPRRPRRRRRRPQSGPAHPRRLGRADPHLRRGRATVLRRVLAPFGDAYTGPLSLALGDVNGDGVSEHRRRRGRGRPAARQAPERQDRRRARLLDALPGLVPRRRLGRPRRPQRRPAATTSSSAAGPGCPPQVKVYDARRTRLLEHARARSAPAFRGGVSVAAGDLSGRRQGRRDRRLRPGDDPRSRSSPGETARRWRRSAPFAASFTGGVSVAAGDLDGGGKADVIAATGSGANSVVRVFAGATRRRLASFSPYGSFTRRGQRLGRGSRRGQPRRARHRPGRRRRRAGEGLRGHRSARLDLPRRDRLAGDHGRRRLSTHGGAAARVGLPRMRAARIARARRAAAGRRDRPRPAGPGLVAVSAAALNPVDISIGNGRFYGGTPAAPLRDRLRGDRAHRGRTARLGPRPRADRRARRSGWRLGVRGPETASTTRLALACGVAGLTGWLAVCWRAPVRPDDTVLVLGASGTRRLGRRPGGEAPRRAAGDRRRQADRSSCRPRPTSVFDLASEAAPPEATLIIDCLWGEPLERALAAAADGRPGRPARAVGGAAGDAPVGLGARQGGRHPRALALRGPARRRRAPATASSASTSAPGRSRSAIEHLPARRGRRGLGAARPRAAPARSSSSRSPERYAVAAAAAGARSRSVPGGARRTAIAATAAAASAQRPPKTKASSVPPTAQSQPISGLASGSGAVQA